RHCRLARQPTVLPSVLVALQDLAATPPSFPNCYGSAADLRRAPARSEASGTALCGLPDIERLAGARGRRVARRCLCASWCAGVRLQTVHRKVCSCVATPVSRGLRVGGAPIAWAQVRSPSGRRKLS